eukprot:767068-Hanusia_phi.AAC.3
MRLAALKAKVYAGAQGGGAEAARRVELADEAGGGSGRARDAVLEPKTRRQGEGEVARQVGDAGRAWEASGEAGEARGRRAGEQGGRSLRQGPATSVLFFSRPGLVAQGASIDPSPSDVDVSRFLSCLPSAVCPCAGRYSEYRQEAKALSEKCRDEGEGSGGGEREERTGSKGEEKAGGAESGGGGRREEGRAEQSRSLGSETCAGERGSVAEASGPEQGKRRGGARTGREMKEILYVRREEDANEEGGGSDVTDSGQGDQVKVRRDVPTAGGEEEEEGGGESKSSGRRGGC